MGVVAKCTQRILRVPGDAAGRQLAPCPWQPPGCRQMLEALKSPGGVCTPQQVGDCAQSSSNHISPSPSSPDTPQWSWPWGSWISATSLNTCYLQSHPTWLSVRASPTPVWPEKATTGLQTPLRAPGCFAESSTAETLPTAGRLTRTGRAPREPAQHNESASAQG